MFLLVSLTCEKIPPGVEAGPRVGVSGLLPVKLPCDGSQQRALPAAHLPHNAHQDTLQGSHVRAGVRAPSCDPGTALVHLSSESSLTQPEGLRLLHGGKGQRSLHFRGAIYAFLSERLLERRCRWGQQERKSTSELPRQPRMASIEAQVPAGSTWSLTS